MLQRGIRFGLVIAGASMTVPALHVSPAAAQGSSESFAKLEEVVVTARRRDESLQDIPLSISAFTAQDIREGGFQDLGDIADQTAGIVYNARSNQGFQGRVNSNVVIRGAQINSTLPHVQTTSLFIDGIFSLGGINSMPLNDLERVEVIKGPQSAFFGRNTFAGAVNYITKTPSLNEREATIDLSVGEYDQYDASFLFSTPIIEDKLSLLVGVRHFSRGSMYSADDGGDLGEEETNSLSGMLYWEPTDRMQVKLRGLFLRDDDGPPVGYLIRGQDLDTCTGRTYPGRYSNDGSPFTIDFTNGRPGSGAPINYLCGKPPGIGSSFLTTRETNIRPDILSQVFGTVDTVNGGFIPGPNPDLLVEQLLDQKSLPGVPSMDRFGLERINRRLSLSVDYEFSNGWAFALLAGHNDQDLNYLRDFDRTNSQAWYSQDPQTMDDDSFEIRLVSGQDQRLRWLVGAAYYEQEFVTSGGGGYLVVGQLAPLTAGILSLAPTSGDEARVQGIFGALSYDITEQLTLDLEARYEEDERTVAASDGTLSTTYDAITPRVILSWQPNDSTNLYAQYSRGALPGRVNGLIASCDPTPFSTPYPDPLNPGQQITLSECEQFARQGASDSTDTQELNAFELGIKKILWDGRVNLSAAVYSWTWDAKPSSLSVTWVAPGPDGEPNPFPNTLGATIGGDSEIIGMDLEAAVALTENWTASLTLTALETEFTSFSDQGLSQITGTGNQKGNEEPFVPNLQASFSTTYGAQLTADWDWFSRLDVSYRGDYYADYENLLEGPSFALAHLRAGVTRNDLRLELFVRNLFDEDTWRQVAGSIDFSPQPANFNFLAFQGASLTPQDRRTVGIRASYSF